MDDFEIGKVTSASALWLFISRVASINASMDDFPELDDGTPIFNLFNDKG
ncbi:hypothetical protein LBMAG01_03950 [Acidobacteriota bacterium]|nr:hypothetical protein LBMAG01_03950 [Acidobacteriota bacterium]